MARWPRLGWLLGMAAVLAVGSGLGISGRLGPPVAGAQGAALVVQTTAEPPGPGSGARFAGW